MSSSVKVCEHHVLSSSVGPSHGGRLGLQVEIVDGGGGGGGGGELVVPLIVHSPDITDRRDGLLGLQICQGSFCSLGEPRELQ